MRIDSIGGRRFIVVMSTLIALALLRWFDHLDNGSFTAVMIASVCAFITGDTWQRHQETKADVAKTLGAPEPPKQ